MNPKNILTSVVSIAGLIIIVMIASKPSIHDYKAAIEAHFGDSSIWDLLNSVTSPEIYRYSFKDHILFTATYSHDQLLSNGFVGRVTVNTM